MTNIVQLSNSLCELITDDNYDTIDFIRLFDPVSEYISDPLFSDNVKQIIILLTKDRDGDKVITIADIKLLSSDFTTISALTASLLFIVSALPNIKITYNKYATEELVFKILTYIFLVLVPKETNNKWTYDDKKAIIQIGVAIYNMLVSSVVVKELVEKIKLYFKKKGWCKCLYEEDKQQILEKNIDRFNLELNSALILHRHIRSFNNATNLAQMENVPL